LISTFILRPLPIEQRRPLAPGIQYFRSVRTEPRRLIIHAIQVDLTSPDIGFLVTPGDPKAEQPLQARTVAKFLSDFNMLVAVNGDGFTPWRSNSILDFYPHSGDYVTPLGFAASQGKDYAKGVEDEVTLYIAKDNQVSFNEPVGNVYNAISGDRILLSQGEIHRDLPQDDAPSPRTAIGLDREGETLWILVVDGRQPGYSEGVTLRELAQTLADYGLETALNLDGGGSSTLVAAGWLGLPQVLNSPVDRGIPGLERPVANHLGVFVK
jgi:exopolysaccharide biosynthesis protein